MTTANESPGRPVVDVRQDMGMARNIALKLLEYCREQGWAGYDPYDALNSRIFRALPFLNHKTARLVMTQGVKRCPVNLRPLLVVPKAASSKGTALFLSALIKLSHAGVADASNTIGNMVDKLLTLRSPESRYSCWGYNFDWQSRIGLLPQGSPNIICTTFAANALLDVFEQSHDSSLLSAAIRAADFIVDQLLWREAGPRMYFSYTPYWRSAVHNANLLGAALLCRVSRLSGEMRFLSPALDATRYSINKQHQDGSWDYGDLPDQRWIDNFHTGFNLVALKRIKEYGETMEFDEPLGRGFEFYKAHFFREDGAPKYFHNSVYPIDTHSLSQSIITLVEFKNHKGEEINLALSALNWGLANMWDRRGFFYFQKYRHYTVRIPYMRWSQAWMLLAIATLLEKGRDTN